MKCPSLPIGWVLALAFSLSVPFLGATVHAYELQTTELQSCSDKLSGAQIKLAEYHRLKRQVDEQATEDNVLELSEAAYEAGVRFTEIYNASLNGRGFRALPMVAYYIGEGLRRSQEFLKPRRPFDVGPYPTVYYFSKAEREAHRLHFYEGRAYWGTGELVTDLGHSEYVLGLNGEFYVLKKEETGDQFRHSSFFSGDPVAGAGTISFNGQGKITRISRASGHYVPSGQSLTVVVNQLKAKGIILAPYAIEYRGWK